jgi:hypothetical protein
VPSTGERGGGTTLSPDQWARGDNTVAVDSVVDNRTSGHGCSAELANELRDSRTGLADRLATIVRSRCLQEAIAGCSYWHPNGFTKLVLDDHPRRGQLRLHVWPEVPAVDDIHGHAWYYASIVLTGELAEITYREAQQGEGRSMWRHSYGQVGHRRFALVDAHPVHLVQVGGPVVRQAGEASGGSPDHIHRFFASRAPAATMLRVGPVVERSSHVYRPTAEPPQIMAPRPTTATEVGEWAAYLAASI